MYLFLQGVTAMGYLVAGLFFLRYWRSSGDRLFAMFAAAFLLMAGNRVAMTALEGQVHNELYWVRFVSFLLILLAIIDKNRKRRPPQPGA